MKEDFSWVKLYRKIEDWGWYQENNTKVVFLHLLIKCNYKESEFFGHKIMPGEICISYGTLSAQLRISVSAVRTAISNLVFSGEISKKIIRKSHANLLIFSLVKWDMYNGQITSEQLQNSFRSTSESRVPKNCIKKECKKEKAKNLTHSTTFKQRGDRKESLIEAVFRDPVYVMKSLMAEGAQFGSPSDE